MANTARFKRIQNHLQQHRQAHLLDFFPTLTTAQQDALLDQIDKLDFSSIDDWVSRYVIHDSPASVPETFEPAASFPAVPSNASQQDTYQKARALGDRLIAQGKVAAFVVAGGQGTRLGFDGPKGNFPVTPVKHKTLFQLFGETIVTVGARYQAPCTWFVMTSPLNHEQTCRIFEDNDFYGLGRENVFIFAQGTLPNFSFDGRILLADKHTLACSPDGHGGSLKALYDSGAVDVMKTRGIEYLSYWQVDNPLINIFDPLFIGLHVMEQGDMSSKALKKTGPFEKVGNFCSVNGRVTVIEYSDLSDDLAEARNPDGSLVFELGSIGIHLVNRSFVEKLNEKGFALPIHRAVKKIPHLDSDGTYITPDDPNGIKLETFVFDALPLAAHSIILETVRSEEFAPVKNAEGVDSAETARRMMIERAATWLERTGISIPRTPDDQVNCELEIAPGFALAPDDLKSKVDQIPAIKPNEAYYLG